MCVEPSELILTRPSLLLPLTKTARNAQKKALASAVGSRERCKSDVRATEKEALISRYALKTATVLSSVTPALRAGTRFVLTRPEATGRTSGGNGRAGRKMDRLTGIQGSECKSVRDGGRAHPGPVRATRKVFAARGSLDFVYCARCAILKRKLFLRPKPLL